MLLILFKHLNVVVNKTQGAKPNGGHKHQQNVNVVQLAEQQGRNQNRGYDYDATHGWRALLLQLTLQTQIAHNLANLLFLK